MTPFTIVNQTTGKFLVVQGGILEDQNEIRVTSQIHGLQNVSTSSQTFTTGLNKLRQTNMANQKKTYNVEPGASCDYAVTYA